MRVVSENQITHSRAVGYPAEEHENQGESVFEPAILLWGIVEY